jgi:Tol biopolymer transport system component
LVEVGLDGSFIRQVSNKVEGTEAFAWSPDGSHLAYMEVDRDKKESRLIVEAEDGSKTSAVSFPFSELNNDGNTLNLQWTPDGKYILFDIEARLGKPMIYFASVDGTESGKLLEAARIPSISADGKWLAYFGIREKDSPQLMLVDFESILSSPLTAAPIHIVDLPVVRNGFEEMDKIRWKP